MVHGKKLLKPKVKAVLTISAAYPYILTCTHGYSAYNFLRHSYTHAHMLKLIKRKLITLVTGAFICFCLVFLTFLWANNLWVLAFGHTVWENCMLVFYLAFLEGELLTILNVMWFFSFSFFLCYFSAFPLFVCCPSNQIDMLIEAYHIESTKQGWERLMTP